MWISFDIIEQFFSSEFLSLNINSIHFFTLNPRVRTGSGQSGAGSGQSGAGSATLETRLSCEQKGGFFTNTSFLPVHRKFQ